MQAVLSPRQPTPLRAGLHLDVARVLKPAGETGLSFMELAGELDGLPLVSTITLYAHGPRHQRPGSSGGPAGVVCGSLARRVNFRHRKYSVSPQAIAVRGNSR